MADIDLREEAEFADEEYSASIGIVDQVNPVMFAKYAHPHELWDWRQKAASLLGDISEKSLLDYGCGQGEEAVYFAKLGARVTAIDISPVGVSMAMQRARANGLEGHLKAFVMNATPTQFPSESFDLVHGMGILHHVGLDNGLNEVFRVLKPGGRAVFLEPFGSNRLVEASKHRIHKLLGSRRGFRPVTSGEANLTMHAVRQSCRIFRRVEIYPYHIVHRVRKLVLPRSLYTAALRFDYQLLRYCPPLRHFAGAAVIHLQR